MKRKIKKIQDEAMSKIVGGLDTIKLNVSNARDSAPPSNLLEISCHAGGGIVIAADATLTAGTSIIGIVGSTGCPA